MSFTTNNNTNHTLPNMDSPLLSTFANFLRALGFPIATASYLHAHP